MNHLEKVIAQLKRYKTPEVITLKPTKKTVKKYTNPNVIKNIEEIIEDQKLDILVDEFPTLDVNWNRLSRRQDLSEDFIREFVDKVNWKKISQWQLPDLSEDFIREFADKVDWRLLSYWKKNLSEDFIREFADYVYWPSISGKQNLSEDFIREFADKVNWDSITWSIYWGDNYSPEFLEEFVGKINWVKLNQSKNLSPEFREEFKDYLRG